MTNGIDFLIFISGCIYINNSNIVRADGGKIWGAILLELQKIKIKINWERNKERRKEEKQGGRRKDIKKKDLERNSKQTKVDFCVNLINSRESLTKCQEANKENNKNKNSWVFSNVFIFKNKNI